MIAAAVCSVPGCPNRVPCAVHPSRSAGSTRAWRRLRAEVLERDGHRCRRCGEEAELVHHRLPVQMGSRELAPVQSLESLCWRCHRLAHRR